MRTRLQRTAVCLVLLGIAESMAVAAPVRGPLSLEEGLARVRRTLLIAIAQINHGREAARAPAPDPDDYELVIKREGAEAGGFEHAMHTMARVSATLALLHARFGGPLDQSPGWADLAGLAAHVLPVLEEASICDDDLKRPSAQISAAVVQDILGRPAAAMASLQLKDPRPHMQVGCGNWFATLGGTTALIRTCIHLRAGRDRVALFSLRGYRGREKYILDRSLSAQVDTIETWLRFRSGDRTGAEPMCRRLALHEADTLEGDLATRLLLAWGSFHPPTTQDYREAMLASSGSCDEASALAVGLARQDFPDALPTLEGWMDSKLINELIFIEALGWLSDRRATGLLRTMLPCEVRGRHLLILHSLLRRGDLRALTDYFSCDDERGGHSPHPVVRRLTDLELPEEIDDDLRETCGGGPTLSDEEVHDEKHMRETWLAWAGRQGTAPDGPVRSTEGEYHFRSLAREPLPTVRPVTTAMTIESLTKRYLAGKVPALPALPTEGEDEADARRPHSGVRALLERQRARDALLAEFGSRSSSLSEPDEPSPSEVRSSYEKKAAEVQALCRRLPGYDEINRRFTMSSPLLGNINGHGFSLHVMLDARDPAPLINYVWWFDPTDEGTKTPRFDWKDLLATLATVEAAASHHAWLRKWRDAVRDRQVQACILGRAPMTQANPALLLLPAWEHAGLAGRPTIEVAFRRGHEWCGRAFLGPDDPRALVTEFTPIKSSHWLDGLTVDFQPLGKRISYIVAEPNGDHRVCDEVASEEWTNRMREIRRAQQSRRQTGPWFERVRTPAATRHGPGALQPEPPEN